VCPKYKYGVQIPRSHEEAIWIDTKGVNTGWQDAEKVELDQLHEYKTFTDLGKGVPVPARFKKIPCHIVYDFKCSDIGSIYPGVMSLPGIRIVMAIAKLNDLEIWGTDVENAYLEPKTHIKVVFEAGEEFGLLAGHLFQIVKALYGLKSSGKR
jgi:hypothetical protein